MLVVACLVGKMIIVDFSRFHVVADPHEPIPFFRHFFSSIGCCRFIAATSSSEITSSGRPPITTPPCLFTASLFLPRVGSTVSAPSFDRELPFRDLCSSQIRVAIGSNDREQCGRSCLHCTYLDLRLFSFRFCQ